MTTLSCLRESSFTLSRALNSFFDMVLLVRAFSSQGYSLTSRYSFIILRKLTWSGGSALPP